MNNIKLSLSTIAMLMGTTGFAIELTDYKIVEGDYNAAYVDGGLSIDSGNQDQVSYDGFVDANLKSIYTSAPYTLEYGLTAGADFSRGPDANQSAENAYDSTAYFEGNKYFKNDDTFFGYGRTDVGYRKQVTADSAEDPYLKVGVGAGYGRMYVATPLANAMRVAEDLKAYKLIKNDISDKALIAMARVIGVQSEYQSKYGFEEYKQYWYEAMEKALKDNGALVGDSLGAVGIVRLNAIIDATDGRGVLARLHGWKVQAGAGQILSKYDGSSSDTTADVGFQYGLPVGYTSQFLNTATASKILGSNNSLDFTAKNLASYTYEMSDKIDWINSWSLGYEAYNTGDDVMTNTLSTRFNYYVANRLSLNARLSFAKTSGTNGTSIETPEWDTSFFTGLRYRLQ